MTLLCEKFSFLKTTTTGTAVDQSITLTGAFQPKILILWSSWQTTTNGTYTDNISWSFGFSDGINDGCEAWTLAETTENEFYEIRDDSVIAFVSNSTQTERARATVKSFNSNGFTLTWNQADSTAYSIHGIAIGGTDITNASVVSTTVQNTSTGNHSFTGSGTAFTPDFALAITGGAGLTAVNSLAANADTSLISIGACTSTKQWVMCAREESVGTSDCDQYLSNSNVLAAMDTLAGTINYLANFVSFDNAAGGGMTVNVTDGATNASNRLAFLFVKGATWDCDTFQQRSGTGTQDITISSGLTSNLTFLTGINDTTLNAVAVNDYVCLGASDGTREGNTWQGNTNNLGTFVTARSNDTGKLYRQATPAATATSSTTNAECDMNDMTTAGKFQVNWTTADTTLRQMAYWVVGTSVAGTQFNRSPTAENITVADSSVTRLLSATRVPTAETITVSAGTATRQTQAFRSVSVDSTTVTDASLIRSKSAARVPTTETITVADSSTTRLLSSARVASDRVTVGEGQYLFAIHIPLYIYPFHWVPGSEWYQLSDLMAANPNVLFILKLNVNSGPDTAVNSDYTTGIGILKSQGNDKHIKLIGYVFTSYGARDIALVKQDIDRWVSFYGADINGIFLDEMDNITGHETYYRELTNYIHKDKGLEISWGNPGNPIDESYVKANAVDVFQIGETTDYPTISTVDTRTFSGTYSPSKFAIGIHSVSTYDSSLISSFITDLAYIFVTGDVMPTPYDTISAYIDDLALQSDAIAKSTRSATRIRAPSADTLSVVDASLTALKTGGGGASFTRAPSADSTTVTELSLVRILSAIRVPTPETSTASENLTRMKSALRIPSTDSVTAVDSSTTKSETRVRTPGTDSISTVDSSLTRILSAVRVPSTEVPALSENVSRMLSASRVPGSDTVITADNATRIRSLLRIPATDSITVTDSSLTRLLSLARIPSTDSITVLDSSLTRIVSLLRIPSQDSITSSENVTGQKIQGAQSYQRFPTAENITVAESSLTRLLSALRLPSSDAITTGESLIRLLSASRSPATDSVVTADNVTRVRSLSRATTADSITVLDSSVTRMLSALRIPTADTIAVTAGTATRILSALRVPSVEVISVSESLGVTLSGRISRSVSDTVNVVEASLNRMLQAFRVVPTDTTNVNEQLSRSRTAVRLTTADTIVVSGGTVTRVVSLTRSVTSDTTAIIEAALNRILQAFRNTQDTVPVSELQSLILHSRALQDTITVTEPVLNRVVTAIRILEPEFVDVAESLFFQTWHRYVFDSVTVAESLFKERIQLSGSVTYAIPDEVRPLLGNLGQQRTNEQIELAIDAAYDEINTKTNRIPPNDWKDTDHNFGIVKKLTRYIAAKEMAIGIKDYDTKPLEMEIEHLFNDLLTYDTTSDATQDIVGSSPDVTFALNEGGIIWSTRYRNLKKATSGENDTTINPNT